MELLKILTKSTSYILIRGFMKIKKIILPILLNILLITLITLVWQHYADKAIIDFVLYVFLLSIVLIFANMELIINGRKLFRQKRSLRAYRQYIPIINELIIEVRHKQKNHIENIKHIEEIVEENDEYHQLCKALDAYSDKLISENVSSTLLKINYKLLAGVLFTMIHKAYEQNVILNINLTAVHFTTRLHEYQLVELVEILVDNAIEATPSGESCYLTLGSLNDKILVKTSNPGPIATPEYIHEIFKEGYTSKNNTLREHGIGLSKLRKIINNNNGDIIVNNEIINEIQHICFEINI